MGTTMLRDNVIRKTPMMKAMKRSAGRGIEQARLEYAGQYLQRHGIVE
ncbi:hypothetical protein ACQ7NP_19650 [Pseudomonas anuradhapurensis]